MSTATDFAAADVTTAAVTTAVDTDVAVDIDTLHDEIERIDADILAAVARRTELTRLVGRTDRSTASSTREMSVLRRFEDLGQEGRTLGMLLLRMGRGSRAA